VVRIAIPQLDSSTHTADVPITFMHRNSLAEKKQNDKQQKKWWIIGPGEGQLPTVDWAS